MPALALQKLAPPLCSTLAHLKEKVDSIEEVQRRFAATVSICNRIDESLPYQGLPLRCIHEVKGSSLAGATAFAAALSTRIPKRNTILYIAPDRHFSPLGLLPYGVKLEHWIHISARRSKDLAWAVLEAIRCPQISAVLAVMQPTDLTFCRRLQLAAESSGVTGFLLGTPHSAPAASAITRWHISSCRGPFGRGFDESFWELELLYCRGGRPGKWRLAWRNNRLETLPSLSEVAARPIHRVLPAARNALAG